MEGRDPAARKVQKADREKIRRDRLNDHFHELGITLGQSMPPQSIPPFSVLFQCITHRLILEEKSISKIGVMASQM